MTQYVQLVQTEQCGVLSNAIIFLFDGSRICSATVLLVLELLNVQIVGFLTFVKEIILYRSVDEVQGTEL